MTDKNGEARAVNAGSVSHNHHHHDRDNGSGQRRQAASADDIHTEREETLEEMQARWRELDQQQWAPTPTPPPKSAKPEPHRQPPVITSQPNRKRLSEIKAVFRNRGEKRRMRFDPAYLEQLRGKLGGLDPLDRKLVPDDKLGAAIEFPVALKKKVENREDAFQRRMGWRKPNKRPFRITTIAASDMTPAQAAAHYTRRRNEARSKKAMTTTQTDFPSYTAYLDTQRTARKERERSVIEAIGEGEHTVAELMGKLRHHDAWSRYADNDKRLEQAIKNCLSDLRTRITNRYMPRPKGGILRYVSRKK